MNKKTLVLGASTNPERYSFLATNKLLDSNHSVVLIGNKNGIIRDNKIETTTIEIDDIDTVTMYIGKLGQKDYYDYIVSLKPKRVIFNPGTENEELYSILEKNQIPFIEACTLVLLSTKTY